MSDEIIFEIGETYRNRIGWYTVLEKDRNAMRVRYEKDGCEQTLKIEDQERILMNILREEEDIHLIAQSRERFFFYIDKCNEHYRFGHDLSFYREIIDMHRKSNGLDSLLHDKAFYPKVRSTLEKWNMDQRGAKLASLNSLKESILAHRLGLIKLYQYKLHSITEDRINHETKGLLKEVFSGLKVMESKRRIVGVSKALHFLLPDLVMPIDSRYTMDFFYGYNKYSNDIEVEFGTFMELFMKTKKLVRRLDLTQNDVNNEGWNTSLPKLIDNAIIGFYKYLENDFQKTKKV